MSGRNHFNEPIRKYNIVSARSLKLPKTLWMIFSVSMKKFKLTEVKAQTTAFEIKWNPICFKSGCFKPSLRLLSFYCRGLAELEVKSVWSVNIHCQLSEAFFFRIWLSLLLLLLLQWQFFSSTKTKKNFLCGNRVSGSE